MQGYYPCIKLPSQGLIPGSRGWIDSSRGLRGQRNVKGSKGRVKEISASPLCVWEEHGVIGKDCALILNILSSEE